MSLLYEILDKVAGMSQPPEIELGCLTLDMKFNSKESLIEFIHEMDLRIYDEGIWLQTIMRHKQVGEWVKFGDNDWTASFEFEAPKPGVISPARLFRVWEMDPEHISLELWPDFSFYELRPCCWEDTSFYPKALRGIMLQAGCFWDESETRIMSCEFGNQVGELSADGRALKFWREVRA